MKGFHFFYYLTKVVCREYVIPNILTCELLNVCVNDATLNVSACLNLLSPFVIFGLCLLYVLRSILCNS